MGEYTISVLYIILITTPFSIIRYYPFVKSLKVKISTLVTIYCTLLAIEILGFFILNEYSGLSITNSNNIYIVIWSSIYYLLSCIVIDERLSKHTFIHLLIGVLYYGCIKGISNYVYAWLTIKHEIQISYIMMSIYVILISILSFPIYIKITNKMIIPMFDSLEDEIWDSMSIILLTLLFSSSFRIYDLDYSEIYQAKYLVQRVLVSICSISVVMILINNTNRHVKNMHLQNKLNSIDKIISIQENQYQNLSKTIMETRRIRHDKRQHLSAINAYIQRKDKEGLFDYISEFLEEIPKEEITYCENDTINLILDHYMKIIKLNNIEVDFELTYSKDANYELYGIKKTDLWICIGNILENAIEGCNRIKGNRKNIYIRINISNNTLSLVIDNSFNGIIQKDSNENFYSLKADNRVGIGINSIESIVEKYNGVSRFTYDKNMFYTSIILKIKGSTAKA